MNGPLNIEYDPVQDVYIIEGVKYSPIFFSMLGTRGMNIGAMFRVVKRSNEVLVIEEVK